MRRIILLVVLMCCLSLASAQQINKETNNQKSLEETLKMVEKMNSYANTFTEKLDSITTYFDEYDGDAKFIFDYDAHFNCTRFDAYSLNNDEWELAFAYEYHYDEQDRLTTMIDYYDYRMEDYIYNAQDLVEEILYSYYETSEIWVTSGRTVLTYDEDNRVVFSLRYVFVDDNWKESSKQTWEYESGLLQNTIYYTYESGEWIPFERTDYSYSSEGLCLEEINSWWSETWKPVSKTVFNYDVHLFCIERIQYGYSNSGEWLKRNKNSYDYDASGNLSTLFFYSFKTEFQDWACGGKYEYLYDEDNNCIEYNDYHYHDEAWYLERSYRITYGIPKAIHIAGLPLWWDLYGFNTPLFNKVNHFVVNNGFLSYQDFHYSSIIGIEEMSDNIMTLWPNPTRDRVVIEGVEVDKVWVYDVLGRIVKYVQATNEINIVGLPEGNYLVRVFDVNGKVFTNRITIH